MTLRYIQPGNTLTYTPTAALRVDDVIAAGAVIGVAATDIPANVPGTLLVEGVFTLPKKPGAAFKFGQKLTWSVTDGALIIGAGVAGDVANGAICAGDVAADATAVAALLKPGIGSAV